MGRHGHYSLQRSEHRMKRRAMSGVLFGALLLAGAAHTLAADRGGHMNYSGRLNLSAFEPITKMNSATTRFCAMIFEQLLERKKIGTGVRCRMCKDYDANDKLITFYLRQDIKWHDGVPFTAYDVEFTYRLISNPKTGSVLRKEFQFIEDATVLDDHSISFSFRHPVPNADAYFLSLPIVPRHKFSVFLPSLVEDKKPGTVREARLNAIQVYAGPSPKERKLFRIPVGAKLTVLKSDKRWAEIKIIAKGPVGKQGWVLQHRPEINEIDDAEFMTWPIGTGPYKFNGSTVSGDANLKVNEDYYGRKGYIRTIRRKRSQDPRTMVNRLTNEVLDLLPETPLEDLARIQQSGVCKLISYASLRFAGLMYNCRNPNLAKKEFRQALTYASNRVQWLDTFYQKKGYLIAGPAAPDSWLYNTELRPLPFDLAKAKKLRASAAGRKPVKLKLVISSDRPSQDMDFVAAYKNAMAQINVNIEIVPLERLVFSETLAKGRFDIAFQEYILNYGYNYRPLFEPDGDQNYGHYDNQELGEIFRAWRRETDFEAIRTLANRSQQILADDCPWTFLWTLKNIAAVHNKIRNIRHENIDPYRFFTWVHQWWIPEEAQ